MVLEAIKHLAAKVHQSGPRSPGITDGRKQKIFEKFYQEDQNKSGGVGLGLAICSGIMEAHGGKIWVEDHPGGGASFKFMLASACDLPGMAPDDEDFADSGAEDG